MVKLIMLSIFRYTGPETSPILLASTRDLSSFSFFTRGTIAEHLRFGSRTVCQRTKEGARQTVGLKDNPFLCHCYVRLDGLCGIAVSDLDYPQRVVYSLINKVLAEFEKQSADKWKLVEADQELEPPFLVEQMRAYQDPNSADKISQIQKELDEVKDVMHKNIEEVLKRGETLDTLMEKSADLSASSVVFAKKAKDQNKCCKAF